MKQQVKKSMKSGFTLIELIIVIAILSFVAAVGISKFGTLREREAKKMNAANIRSITHAIEVYDLAHAEDEDRFDNFDSLLDVKGTSSPNANSTSAELGYPQIDQGQAGKAEFLASITSSSIIYDGDWKLKEGDAVSEAQKNNKGISDELEKMLGVYYLTESEAKLVREAGISQVLLHNNQFTAANCKDKVGGGGPSMRPDMSAFAPMAVSNGTAVAVLRPDAASVWAGPVPIGDYTYVDLGFALPTNTVDMLTFHRSSNMDAFKTMVEKGSVKLLVFGIGRGCNFVRKSVGLGDLPVDPVYDRKYYRNYLAVFALGTFGDTKQGGVTGCRFVGVLDAAGRTQTGADYVANWQVDVN